MDLIFTIWPELSLSAVACVLFLMGVSRKASLRQASASLALVSLVGVFVGLILTGEPDGNALADAWGTIRIYKFAFFIKLLVTGIGALLVLLCWPSDKDAQGNMSLRFGHDAGEFFGLMLLSITGVMLVASANDMILLFLGIELASIPTYVMVSISRPTAVAQEAGVKYFFLGAMAAAIMLFGFSYLYGTTGLTNLHDIGRMLRSTSAGTDSMAPALSGWQMMAAVMLLAGFAFKIAAVPLHFYAGDVYQGAATPVTAFLAFVPKTSGFVALIKMLYVFGGNAFVVPETIVAILWVVAVLTMTVGNMLGLMQNNVKRVLAYSSIAHTGYMLVGLTAALYGAGSLRQSSMALQGVLFYLAAYGMMNVAAFAVLTVLPSRSQRPGARNGVGAETFEDLAGQGRRNIPLGLAMAVTCFSLTGLPLTVGFFGKVFLIKPAFDVGLKGLVIIMMINAAISAGYYLRIVAAMFLRDDPETAEAASAADAPSPVAYTVPLSIVLAIILSVGATLLFGTVYSAAQLLSNSSETAVQMDSDSSGLRFDLAEPEEDTPADALPEPTARAAD